MSGTTPLSILRGIAIALILCTLFEPAWAQDTNRFIIKCQSEDDGVVRGKIAAVMPQGTTELHGQGEFGELPSGAKLFASVNARPLENGVVHYGEVHVQVRVLGADGEPDAVGGFSVGGILSSGQREVPFTIIGPPSAIKDREGLFCIMQAHWAQYE